MNDRLCVRKHRLLHTFETFSLRLRLSSCE